MSTIILQVHQILSHFAFHLLEDAFKYQGHMSLKDGATYGPPSTCLLSMS